MQNTTGSLISLARVLWFRFGCKGPFASPVFVRNIETFPSRSLYLSLSLSLSLLFATWFVLISDPSGIVLHLASIYFNLPTRAASPGVLLQLFCSLIFTSFRNGCAFYVAVRSEGPRTIALPRVI